MCRLRSLRSAARSRRTFRRVVGNMEWVRDECRRIEEIDKMNVWPSPLRVSGANRGCAHTPVHRHPRRRTRRRRHDASELAGRPRVSIPASTPGTTSARRDGAPIWATSSAARSTNGDGTRQRSQHASYRPSSSRRESIPPITRCQRRFVVSGLEGRERGAPASEPRRRAR